MPTSLSPAPDVSTPDPAARRVAVGRLCHTEAMTLQVVRRTAAGLLAAGLLLLASGCGDDDGSGSARPTASDTPSGTPSEASTSAAPEGPDCSTVWVEGETLDRKYRGCVQDGVLVTAEKVGCSSGQTFVLFQDEFWAVKGGTIKRAAGGLAADEDYRADMAACRG